MDTRWYWIVGIIGVVGLVAVGWMLLPTPEAPETTNNIPNNYPQDTNYVAYPSLSDTSSTDSTSAGAFSLNDPAVTKDPINKGYYFIGYHPQIAGYPDATATANPPYLIIYIAATDYYTIALLQEPLKQTREQAEQYLIEKTGYSHGAMCHLRYMVSVPNSVSQIYAGQNLGWSFCPGAVQLP